MKYAYKQKINRLLKQRHKEFPSRKGAYVELDKELKKFAEFILKRADFDYVPSGNIQEGAGKLWQNPVFICGAKKSGTTMLLELLDGHENLLALPGDSFHAEKFLYGLGRNYSFDELAKHWIYKFINPKGQEPFWYLGENEEKYREFAEALYFYQKKYKDPFRAVVSAVYSVNYEKYKNVKRWVEKTPGNELYARKLAKKFPRAQFIHIQRDPFENIASLKKSRRARGSSFSIERAIYNVEYSRQLSERNRRKIGENRYFLVKYKDLVADCGEQMKNLAAFLDISFSDVFCVPTSAGRPAVSNSAYANERVVGKIDKAKTENKKWKQILTKKEQKRIENFLGKSKYARVRFFVYYILKTLNTTF